MLDIALAIIIAEICIRSSAFQMLMRESYELGRNIGNALLSAILKARQTAAQPASEQSGVRHD